MKSLLKKQEKELHSKLSQSKESKASFLLLLAELKYFQGDRQQAVSLVHESLDAPWNITSLSEIADKFTGNCLTFCDLPALHQLFVEKKQEELGKKTIFEQIKALFLIHWTPFDDSEFVNLRNKVLELKDAAATIERKRFLMKHLLLLEEQKISLELKSVLVREFEDTLKAEPYNIIDKITLLKARHLLKEEPHSGESLLDKTNELMSGVTDSLHRAELNLIKGELLESSHSNIAAMRAYEAGLRHLQHIDCPLTVQLSLNLSRLYGQFGLFRQAIRQIDEGLRLSNLTNTGAVASRLLQFQLLRQSNKTAMAQQIGQIILKSELTPEMKSRFLLDFATMLLDAAEYDTARMYCDDIEVVLLPQAAQSDYYFLLSQFHLVSNEKEKAIPLLSQSITLDTDHRSRVQRKLLLGRLYKELGQLEEGVETLKAVTAESPETDEAQTAVADMKELREELEGSKLDDVVTISKKKKLLGELTEKIGEKSLFERLHLGLRKTRDSFVSKLEQIISSGAINDDVFDEVEETLILADVGYETTNLITTRLRNAYKEEKIKTAADIKPFLIDEISSILSKYQGSLQMPPEPPFVIMIIGVNGVGKTTTIAKLAYTFLQDEKSVLLAAADTFRAGAIEQISEWSNRLNIDVVKHKSGSDPSAVAYDAIHAAKARKKDVLIIDTAGRLHTKVNLMEELKKIRRIVNRELDNAPHEVLLVLDATNGQNAISQAKVFKQDLDVSGIILTKLDGTAKGGIIISIANELDIPVKYIGVGEKMFDLRPFQAKEFVEALFGVER